MELLIDEPKLLEIQRQTEPLTYLRVFDFVVVHVLGARSILTNVLVLCELVDEDLGAVPSVGLREAELGLRLLDGERQFAKRCVGLLRVQSLCKSRQV